MHWRDLSAAAGAASTATWVELDPAGTLHASAPPASVLQQDGARGIDLPAQASLQQLRSAYRARARELHPDMVAPEARPLAEEDMKTLNAAYRRRLLQVAR